jgi:hypothetical protein
MITFRTEADIPADRRVTVCLPPDTPLGSAELVVTVSPKQNGASPAGSLRNRFGSVHSGDATSADNGRIDDDLARAYGDQQS